MITDLLLLERLSERDLAFLAGVAGVAGAAGGDAERADALRRRPAETARLLEDPEVFAALFETGGEDPLVLVSPFAAFAVLVERTPEALRGRAFVPERVGARSTVPVFEVEPLRELVADPLRRLFLADLLASYTHVTSGAVWSRGQRGWRRRRFSELDPQHLAELALSVPAHERLPVYRRLGDLALFLSGVFPDWVEAHPLPPIAVERIKRALAGGDLPAAGPAPGTLGPGLGSMALLETVGRRAYKLASAASVYPGLGMTPALDYVAGEFRHARMVLNFITDSYLRGMRDRWFPLGGA
jgi:hypothetical protein